MQTVLVRVSVLGLVVAGAACGGGGSGTSPSPTTSAPSGASVTVSIMGDRGNKSFNPNPVSPGAPLTVAWQNADGVAHRIVANDTSFDTGNIGANGTSTVVTVPSGGVNYHCSIHPGMVGAINGSSGTAPPCTGPYCAEP